MDAVEVRPFTDSGHKLESLKDYYLNSEPSLKSVKPSSNTAQDVTHILADVFKDLYTQKSFDEETTGNLIQSSEGSNDHHKKCIYNLKKVQEEYSGLLEEYEKVEKHIIEARARAHSADTRSLKRATGDLDFERYVELGLPSVDTSFRWCIDEQLLSKHHLITPSKIFPVPRCVQKPPKKKATPNFLMPTQTSLNRTSRELPDDGYVVVPRSDKMIFQRNAASQDHKQKDEQVKSLSSDSGVHTQDYSASFKQAQKKDKKNSPVWREQMDQIRRIEDRKALAKLAERHDFLKNPRFLPVKDSRGAKLLTSGQPKLLTYKADRRVFETVTDSSVQYFKPKPEVLTFTEWSVGNVYEAILEFRNESAVSRQIRVLPPKTSYFSLGLGKFPGDQGIVAPGMSVQYSIRFMPDGLCDYNDHVEVVSQAVSYLKVAIRAQRSPPVLTLSETMQCGHCLVGGIKLTRLPIKNLGGNGRFCLMKKSSWPASNFKTVVNPAALEVGVFQIRPALFDVLSGQTVLLDLYFAPPGVGTYREEVLMICDNCQVKTFVIEGHSENAAVDLVSVSDGGLSEVKLGETFDQTANFLIRFEPLNALTFFVKQIVVQNLTHVELPFTWRVLKPNLSTKTRGMLELEGNDDPLDFFPDEHSPFVIEPPSGVMRPNEQHFFFLTFAPHKVGTYDSVLHLMLSGIPKTDENHNSTNTVMKPISSTDDDAATKACKSASRKMSGKTIEYKTEIALEVEVKAECEPYSIVLNPPVIVVPGEILEASTIRRPLHVMNYSTSPVSFRWSLESESDIIAVDPPVGKIDPGQLVEMEVKITAASPGNLASNLMCVIDQMEQPIVLPVQAFVRGPQVVIEASKLNFGLMRQGTRCVKSMLIRNTTPLSANWRMRFPDLDDCSEIQVTPDCGELSSLEVCEVQVAFHPCKQRSFKTVLKMEVERGDSSHIEIAAEVQTPQACFIESVLEFDETYLRTTRKVSAQLLNQTAMQTAFRFGEATGEHACLCQVKITPRKPYLDPNELQDIEVELVCEQVGELSKVYIPCFVSGMDQPIILALSTLVQDLKVDLSIRDEEGNSIESDDPTKPLKFCFPQAIGIGTCPSFELSIKNTTAITTTWAVHMKNFMAPQLAVEKSPVGDSNVPCKGGLQLKRTPNLADPKSKSAAKELEEKSSRMLADDNGIAFEVFPTEGALKPFETQKVRLTVYSNMWGKYKDVFTCSVKGIEPVDIPVEIDVLGWPITFKLASPDSLSPTLRFGTHLSDDRPVKRVVRINNNSPCDIRIDWRTYNYAKDDDKQLIDFNVWYGEAFPLCDKTRDELASFKKPVYRPTAQHEEAELLPDLSDSSDEDNDEVATDRSHNLLHSNDRDGSEEKNEADGDIVSVRFEIHEGDKSDCPYEVGNMQFAVPGFGETLATIWLKPTSVKLEGGKSEIFNAYSLGYLSLEDQCKSVGDHTVREDGYGVKPLRLEMTSTIRRGLIDVEDDDNEFYSIPLSDMIDAKSETKVQIRSFILRNTTLSSMSFKLAAQQPFFIWKQKKELAETSFITLPAHTNIKVKVGFKIDKTMLELLLKLRRGAQVKNTNLLSHEGAEIIEFDNSLRIILDNGNVMRHPICGRVPVPTMHVCDGHVDFGMAFIGQQLRRVVTVRNLSPSKTYWSLAELAQKYNRSLGEIRFEPREGVLPAFTSNLDEVSTNLIIEFVAKCTQPLVGHFVVKNTITEAASLIRVSGQGSSDGAHEYK